MLNDFHKGGRKGNEAGLAERANGPKGRGSLGHRPRVRPDPELGPIGQVTGISLICSGDCPPFSEAEFDETLPFPEAEVKEATLRAEDEGDML